MRKKIDSMLLFKNGNIATFSGEEQVPEVQRNAVELWATFAEQHGCELNGCEVSLPDGTEYILRKRDDGTWGQ